MKANEVLKRVNDYCYANDAYTLFRPDKGLWSLYFKGKQVDRDMFRWDVCERNNLTLTEI